MLGKSSRSGRRRSPRTHSPAWQSSPFGARLTPSLAAVPGRSARTAAVVVSAPRPSEVATGPSALSIYLSICPHWPMLRVALRRRRCRRERYDAAARRCADVARRPTGCQGRSSRCACSWGPAALSIVYTLPRDRQDAVCAVRFWRPDRPCLASPSCAASRAPHARPLPHRCGSASWLLQWAARKRNGLCGARLLGHHPLVGGLVQRRHWRCSDGQRLRLDRVEFRGICGARLLGHHQRVGLTQLWRWR